MPTTQLNAFLDWLRLEEIAVRSRLTEKDADHIADDIKAHWWEANKESLIPPDQT